MNKSIKKIIALGMGVAMIAGSLVGCTQQITPEQLQSAKESSFNEGVDSVDIPTCPACPETVCPSVEPLDCPVLEDVMECQCEIDTATAAGGYMLEDLEIGAEFQIALSDREIGLYDEEIRFEGDEYDIEEVLSIKGTVSVNGEDYSGDDYLLFNEGDLSYEVRFDLALDISDIDEEDTLSFYFLGEEVESSERTVDSITFTKGDILLFEGEKTTRISKEYGEITVGLITDNEVTVSVEGDKKTIKEGDTERVGDLEIHVKEAIENEAGDPTGDSATLEVGKDVLVEVQDGDEYADDSIWEWAIDADSIGLVLVEEFKYLDEEFAPLRVTGEISLPNDYITLVYNGLSIEDEVELSLDLAKQDQYVRVKGEFELGLNDYEKVYIDINGIYDDDLVLIGNEVNIAGSDDVKLRLDAGMIEIDDIEISLALDTITVDGNDISHYDETYVTSYGIRIADPDNGADDNDFDIVIPEEELVASVSVLSK